MYPEYRHPRASSNHFFMPLHLKRHWCSERSILYVLAWNHNQEFCLAKCKMMCLLLFVWGIFILIYVYFYMHVFGRKYKILLTWECIQRGSWLPFPFPGDLPNRGIPHCRQILYQLSHKGSPRILAWAAYPISSRSSQPKNRTRVSCIAGRFFTNWATREAQ